MENEKESPQVSSNKFGPSQRHNKKNKKRKQLRSEAVTASLMSSVPCIFTTTIGFLDSSKM